MDQTTLKKCSKCGECKPATRDFFYRFKASKDGLAYQCKACAKAQNKAAYKEKAPERIEYARRYREENKSRITESRAARYEVNREELLARQRRHRSENIDFYRARQRAYTKTKTFKAWRRKNYAENRESFRHQAQIYRAKPENAARAVAYELRYQRDNREKVNLRRETRRKARMRSDITFAMRRRIAGLVRQSIRRLGFGKRSLTTEIIGCDWTTFTTHIERQFLKGMTWENRSEWHIDHIIPLSTAKTEEDVIRLNHYTNLRPLWAKDNLAKSDKVLYLI